MLSTALHRAQTGLATVSEQIDVVSRNVSRRGDPDAVRKVAALSTAHGGGVRLMRIDRAADEGLLEAALSASSATAGLAVTGNVLGRLQALVGEAGDERSPASLIGKLSDALQMLSSNPADDERARAVVNAAHTLAGSLNEASDKVIALRRDVDQELAQTVASINDRLDKLELVNRKVVAGTATGMDVTDAMDQRDSLVKALAEDIGLRTVQCDGGDIALFTDSGVALFETVARPVVFTPTSLAHGLKGASVRIDGVPVAGPGQTMAIETGRVRALIDARDRDLEIFSAQLDELARGTIAALAETPNTVGGLDNVPGLLSAPGATSIYPDGVRVPGLAAQIFVNPAYDPAQGGNVGYVRDGGSAGLAYVSNSSSASGYSQRIGDLIANLSLDRDFATQADLDTNASVLDFATSSVAWIARNRQATSDSLEYRSAVFSRATEALSRETGVSLDQEMARMLELERGYQASSRLLTAIDEMYRVLLGTAG